uniref:Uncharacterized protein n=1 Tax=Anguilla anguilla TaxID=7936 RepID=A0A0E9PVE3_ANGAN
MGKLFLGNGWILLMCFQLAATTNEIQSQLYSKSVSPPTLTYVFHL